MTKELEQVKQALKLADEAFGVWQVSCPNDAKAQKGLKEALAALDAYEARLDSSELEEKRSFYITYQYTAPNAILTASAAVHNVEGVLTCEVITSWAEQLEKEQGHKNCNIIFYKELEKPPLKQ